MKPGWLVTHCALCGDPFPLTAPIYANMSRTYHQSQLPCPCETRKPPEPERPQKALSEMSPEEVARQLEGFWKGRPAFMAKVDLDP